MAKKQDEDEAVEAEFDVDITEADEPPATDQAPAPIPVPLPGPVTDPLHYGQRGQDVVTLQEALRGHTPGGILALTGVYDPPTDQAVRACQRDHGFPLDVSYHSQVGPKQAAHLGIG